MAKLTTEELIEQFKELTLIELSEFVKAFEETFDVTAAAPAAVAVAAAPGAAGGDGQERAADVPGVGGRGAVAHGRLRGAGARDGRDSGARCAGDSVRGLPGAGWPPLPAGVWGRLL